MRRLLKALLAIPLSLLPAPTGRGPGLHLGWRFGWLWGRWFLLRMRVRTAVFGGEFRAGRGFILLGYLRVRGPGSVHLGDDVIVDMRTDLYTNAPDALIRVGDRSFLNGPRLSCVQSITIGPDCIVSDARLMDTDFHSVHRDRHRPDAPIRVAPITIGRNVWLGSGAYVLPGITIGDDAVVGLGSIVTKDVAPGVIVAGNPAREVGKVPGCG